METIRSAAEQLKELYGGKGKIRMKLFISVKGIKLYNYSTMVSSINETKFCYLDPFTTVTIVLAL